LSRGIQKTRVGGRALQVLEPWHQDLEQLVDCGAVRVQPPGVDFM
jgi:hypothetical protein